MKRQDEQREFARAGRIGRGNLEVISAARQWCQHLRVEMESSGLMAEVTGLPVGTHSITCPHAGSLPGGMNLQFVLPDFVVGNCRGCRHHAPAGNVSWGQSILAECQRREDEARARETVATQRLDELRSRLRALTGQAKAAEVTEQKILEWVEQLFGQVATVVEGSVARLREAVPVAAELFGEAAVNALVEGGQCDPFRAPCLSVLARLADFRPDLDARLRAVAAGALQAGCCLESACAVLAPGGRNGVSWFTPDVVAAVIGLQNHIRPVGGWSARDPKFPIVDVPPDYAASTRFLVRIFDAAPATVLDPLRAALRDNQKNRRVNACGVIAQIADHRPAVLQSLVTDLLASLELDDDVYGESADHAAAELLARVFLSDPARVDELLAARTITASSPELRVATIGVYGQVFGSGHDWSARQAGTPDDARRPGCEVALRRCLSWLSDESLDLEVRRAVVEVIDGACLWWPDVVLPAFDVLLGLTAILSLRDEPSPLPLKLIVPGEPEPSRELLALQRSNRETEWKHFKRRVEQCLERVVGERPGETVATLIASYERLDTKTHERFKATVLTLLGKAGGHAECLPLVLPSLWRGLVAFDSVLLRGVAVQAVTECFRHTRAKPPADMVDILLVHLRDSYLLVHQSVIDGLTWHTEWLGDEQVPDVLNTVAGWAASYKQSGRAHDLERPVELALSLSRRLPASRPGIVSWLADLLPNDAGIFDRTLLDEFVRGVSPRERGAGAVTVRLGEWLGRQVQRPFDLDDRRVEWFVWLHRLRRTEFRSAEASLRAAALQAATHNPPVAVLFAGVFAAFDRFATEREILAAARATLPDGRLHGRNVQALTAFHAAAEANDRPARLA